MLMVSPPILGSIIRRWSPVCIAARCKSSRAKFLGKSLVLCDGPGNDTFCFTHTERKARVLLVAMKQKKLHRRIVSAERYLTVPNVLSTFRIVLIAPVANAVIKHNFDVAICVFLVSAFTDMVRVTLVSPILTYSCFQPAGRIHCEKLQESEIKGWQSA